MSELTEELCKRYAVESSVARTSQSILQRVKCEFASKPYSPVYSSDFVCLDPGEPGRLACTLMTKEELDEEVEQQGEGGICDTCRQHRIPALNDLREAKRRMAKTRKEIVREGG